MAGFFLHLCESLCPPRLCGEAFASVFPLYRRGAEDTEIHRGFTFTENVSVPPFVHLYPKTGLWRKRW
jgi:hypothetical protein